MSYSLHCKTAMHLRNVDAVQANLAALRLPVEDAAAQVIPEAIPEANPLEAK